MLERILKPAVLSVALAVAFSSCSHFTQSGRQQLAYAHYVRKMSHNKVKQQTKFKKVKVPPSQTPSDPNVSTESGPQAVSSGSSGSDQ
jgi:hypothetical protein